jgi:hypothetical protein
MPLAKLPLKFPRRLSSQIESTSDALQRASGTEELCGWRRERC